ncbi:MAG: membrane protein [Peptococcaceae bacterium BRH_c8a]|nr:MAG: membrane protein [Peptococcaceae bacterium BRH_c8a]
MKIAVQNITTFKVAAVYIGTVVGAGFATGQEVLQFFSFFGLTGFIALLLATTLFVFFGMIILELGRRLGADSHREIIQYAAGPWLGKVIDGIITFFLFGALTAMAAGAGAIFTEQFGLPHLMGSLVLVVATLITVLIGISGVISAISYVVPVLLLAVFGIAWATLTATPLDMGEVNRWAGASRPAVPFWFLSAVVYVSYNLVLGVAVLAPMGKHIRDAKVIRKGALYGGIGLGLGALAINLTLLANVPQVSGFEVPMVFIAAGISPLVQVVYSIVLLAEVYTTAVGSLYGFVERITDQGKPMFLWLVIGTGAAAFAAGQLGFSTLVRVLYPAVGYAGLLMLGGLFYGYVKERMVPSPAFKPRE